MIQSAWSLHAGVDWIKLKGDLKNLYLGEFKNALDQSDRRIIETTISQERWVKSI